MQMELTTHSKEDLARLEDWFIPGRSCSERMVARQVLERPAVG